MVRERGHVNTCRVLTPAVTTVSVLSVNSKPRGFVPDDGRTIMDTYQVHWTEGRGLPGQPKGTPRVGAGTLAETTALVTLLHALWAKGLAHSISVFDVDHGRRTNVTDSFVPFDSRPRRFPDVVTPDQASAMASRFTRASV